MLSGISSDMMQALNQYLAESNSMCSIQETIDIESMFPDVFHYAPIFLAIISLSKELKLVDFLTSLAHERPTEDDIENFFSYAQP